MKKLLLFMIEKMLLYKKETSQGDFGTMQPFHCCLTSFNKDIGNLAKLMKKKNQEVFVIVVNIENIMVKTIKIHYNR